MAQNFKKFSEEDFKRIFTSRNPMAVFKALVLYGLLGIATNDEGDDCAIALNTCFFNPLDFSDVEFDVQKFGTAIFRMCRVSDGCEVPILLCLDDGVTTYKDQTTGAVYSESEYFAAFTQCEKQVEVICGSYTDTFASSEKIDNAFILNQAIAAGAVYQDNTPIDATADIIEIDYAIRKTASGVDWTYNGGTIQLNSGDGGSQEGNPVAPFCLQLASGDVAVVGVTFKKPI